MAHGAGELGVETALLPRVHIEHNRTPLGHTQCRFKTLGESLGHVWTNLQPINHHIEIVLFILLQRGHLARFINVCTQAKAHKAAHLQRRQLIRKLAFFTARQRRQNHDARVTGQAQHGVHHLRDGLRLQRHPMLRAMGCTGSG